MIVKLGRYYLDVINSIYSKSYGDVKDRREGKRLTLKQSVFVSVLINAGDGVIVSKETIVNEVWNGITSQESLTQMVNKIRGLLGDDDKEILKNHLRQGYSISFTLVSESDSNEFTASVSNDDVVLSCLGCNCKKLGSEPALVAMSTNRLRALAGVNVLWYMAVSIFVAFIVTNYFVSKYVGLTHSHIDKVIMSELEVGCLSDENRKKLVCQ